MPQHSSLSPERWAQFSLDQQILMIGNEMNRGKWSIEQGDRQGLSLSYERVLRLLDLTVEVQRRSTLRRELLLWRGLIAELYIRTEPSASDHDAALRALLQFTPVTAQQIPFVLA
jgi:hypothetical protein